MSAERTQSNALPAIAAVLSGVLFGVGLIVGGMTDPAKVIGFLDFTGEWVPALVFVLGGAVAVHFLLIQLVLKRQAPVFAPRFLLPTKKELDARLLGGAALFGVGWGLAGYCPGPGLVSAGAAGQGAMVFVATMIVGMLVQHALFAPRPEKTVSPC